MSTTCQICLKSTGGPRLCSDHHKILRDALDRFHWYWEQLDITLTRQDRLNLGIVGGKSNDTPSPIAWGASRLAEDVEAMLQKWTVLLVQDHKIPLFPTTFIDRGFIGPLPAHWRRLPRGKATQHAAWLRSHLHLLAGRDDVKDFYFDITGLPDRLAVAINVRTKVFVGPCPFVVGYNHDGEEVECAELLSAYVGEEQVTCPKKHPGHPVVNVKQNRIRSITSRDLMPEKAIVEWMAILGEPVSESLVQKWISKGRLVVHGWLHNNEIVPAKIHHKDPRVLSLAQAQALRAEMAPELELAGVGS